MLNFLKMSDVDPRELIILFDDIAEDLRPALNEHIQTMRSTETLSKNYEALERQERLKDDKGRPQAARIKYAEAKKAIRNLFHHLNQRYLSELRKDEDKQAEFMYSDYARNINTIKKDERKLLKEIVPFVQTALIRLYIEESDEKEEDRRQKIYDFFN